MVLDKKTIAMASGPNFATFTTLFKDGSPQTHIMWIDTDGEYLLINTEIHRAKYLNTTNDKRVNVMIWKHDDTFKFVEIRGKVVGEIKGKKAFENIHELSHKYWNKAYPFEVQTERIILKIEAEREFFFNLKDEDFDF